MALDVDRDGFITTEDFLRAYGSNKLDYAGLKKLV